MCLGVPGQVVAFAGHFVEVESFGERRQLRNQVEGGELRVGDYVMSHLGAAVWRIPASEVALTLELYEEILKHMQVPARGGRGTTGMGFGELE